jgi:hypothetical protein
MLPDFDFRTLSWSHKTGFVRQANTSWKSTHETEITESLTPTGSANCGGLIRRWRDQRRRPGERSDTLGQCPQLQFRCALLADLLQFGFSEIVSSPESKNIPLPPKAKSVA